ncbi:MAG: methylated-DNA--[protein]-cysteine S-methyltransferase [Desulfobacterales bacterium]|nr:methylated-DNA--[protein]-cysteine S-methyltransferase [Desulfobacterales bacterium]
MSNAYYDYHESPIGLIEITGGRAGGSAGVTAVEFVDARRESYESNAVTADAARQLAEYFDGKRREFELELSFEGTDFQKRVWRRLLEVPFGRLASYKDIAEAVGSPRAVRAVGAANGANPIAIIAPCHRVIGSNGKLVGYGGGLWRKEWLLKHEGAWSPSADRLPGAGRKQAEIPFSS